MKYFLLGRLRLGVLPLRPRPALRLRQLGRPAEAVPSAVAAVRASPTCCCYVGLALLLVGLLFKAGVAPFHSWTPDVYQGSPTPVTAFMASCTKVAAFGAILRVLYVGFSSTAWTWRPIMWAVAIASMGVGALFGLTQPTSSGCWRTRRSRTPASCSSRSSRYPRPSVSAVLFYLLTYGIATLAAFGLLMVVRDGDGEATQLSQWSGLARKSPAVAAIMTILLLSMAGIPLTAGFIGKFVVFRAAIHTAGPLVVIALICSAIAAFFYLRIVVVMYFAEPPENSPTDRDPRLVDHDRAHLRRGRHRRAGHLPAAPPRSGRQGREPRRVSPAPARSRVHRRCPRGVGAVHPGRDRGAAAHQRPGRRRLRRVRRVATSSTPAASGSGRSSRRWRRISAIRQRAEIVPAAVVVELTHLATLYHDDVMDEARRAPRRSVGQRALGQHRRDPDRRLPVLARVEPACRPRAARRCACRPGRSNGSSPVRSARPSGPSPAPTPIDHYLAVLADKTGSLIATAAEFGGHYSGADEATVATLRDFGEQIGVAFQISDDILDIASESDQSGKTPGTDLREGVPTLPVLYALRSDDPGRRPTARPGLASADRRCASTPRRCDCSAARRRWIKRAGRCSPTLTARGTCSPVCRTCRPAQRSKR